MNVLIFFVVAGAAVDIAFVIVVVVLVADIALVNIAVGAGISTAIVILYQPFRFINPVIVEAILMFSN